MYDKTKRKHVLQKGIISHNDNKFYNVDCRILQTKLICKLFISRPVL